MKDDRMLSSLIFSTDMNWKTSLRWYFIGGRNEIEERRETKKKRNEKKGEGNDEDMISNRTTHSLPLLLLWFLNDENMFNKSNQLFVNDLFLNLKTDTSILLFDLIKDEFIDSPRHRTWDNIDVFSFGIFIRRFVFVRQWTKSNVWWRKTDQS